MSTNKSDRRLVGSTFVPQDKKLGLHIVVWASNGAYEAVPVVPGYLLHKSRFLARCFYGSKNLLHSVNIKRIKALQLLNWI